MTTKSLIAATLGMSLGLCACGDDDNAESLSMSEARLGFQGALVTLTEGSASALRFGDSLPADETSVAYRCREGGTVTMPIVELTDIVFSCTVDGSTTTLYDVSFTTTATYDDCVVDGVAINGVVTYNVEEIENDSTCTSTGLLEYAPIVVAYALDGVLEFSGKTEGTCPVDIDWLSTDEDFTGTICGFDAVDFASAP